MTDMKLELHLTTHKTPDVAHINGVRFVPEPQAKTQGEVVAEKMVTGGYQINGDPDSVFIAMGDGQYCYLHQPVGCSGSVDIIRKSFAAAIDAETERATKEVLEPIKKAIDDRNADRASGIIGDVANHNCLVRIGSTIAAAFRARK